MKFALLLSESLVPEWRAQYLDYKAGKKRLKKIGKNVANPPLIQDPVALQGFSAGAREQATAISKPTPAKVSFPQATDQCPDEGPSAPVDHKVVLDGFSLGPPATAETASTPVASSTDQTALPRATPISSLNNPDAHYGTIAQTDPLQPLPPPSGFSRLPTLDTNVVTDQSPLLDPTAHNRYTPRPVQQTAPDQAGLTSTLRRNMTTLVDKIPAKIKALTPPERQAAVRFDEMYTSDEQDFMDWLDAEFLKIQTFYKKKEDEGVERYLILQDQLFNLREQRYNQKVKQEKKMAHLLAANRTTLASSQKVTKEIKHKITRKFDLPSLPTALHNLFFTPSPDLDEEELQHDFYRSTKNRIDKESLTNTPDRLEAASRRASIKPTASYGSVRSTGVQGNETATTTRRQLFHVANHQNTEEDQQQELMNPMTGHTRDYTRRIRDQKISYSVARRQLKMAVVELYRELEMLKSYRSLNLTGMRKILKKFDKTSGHHALPSYMAKVNQSYLNKTEILDDLIAKTEDMFAIYFENGNHKMAVEKLRANAVHEEHYMETFITGLCIGLSIPFIIRATWMGLKSLHNGDPDALFLFQIWGGFFLVIMILCLFAVNCIVWTRYKINYPFVFEFNPLHHLTSNQIGTVPSFLLFLMSILGWLCFEDFWEADFRQIYFPPIFLALAVAILLWPYSPFHLNARKWLSIAFWRVFFSGFYPVEFRDLIVGDICCSLTYSISNAAFFFCLYATHWSGLVPGNTSGSSCGSSHSRWMGFLSALPGIWRFLQCGRRYLDSGDAFPHLANMGKYTLLICTNAFLSAYRIRLDSSSLRTSYIVFASLNTLMSSFWDLFMDWSLMQIGSTNFLLRDELAFKSPLPYYLAMVVDPILRCNWIFYIIYANQVQQSAKVSFFVALSEALRRFIWVFFRVENEHCSNVLRFRASRDITLPFTIVKRKESPLIKGQPGTKQEQELLLAGGRPEDEESVVGTSAQGAAGSAGGASATAQQQELPAQQELPTQQALTEALQRRATFGQRLYRLVAPVLETVGKTLQTAHVRDFERRKDKPKSGEEGSGSPGDTDDEEEEDEDILFAEEQYLENLIDTDVSNDSGPVSRPEANAAGSRVQSPRLSARRRQHRHSGNVVAGAGGSSTQAGGVSSPRIQSQMESESARDWRDKFL